MAEAEEMGRTLISVASKLMETWMGMECILFINSQELMDLTGRKHVHCSTVVETLSLSLLSFNASLHKKLDSSLL